MVNLKKILDSLIKKDSSVVVVDFSSGLKLFNIQLKPEVKISFSKFIALSSDSKHEDIIEAIKTFLQEQNIQHKKAVLNPSLNSLIIKRFSLPAMPYSELTEAIKWNLKDELGAEYSSATLDFQVIKEETKSDGAKALDILCAAAKYSEVKDQVLLVKQSGLDCVSVIPSAFGYAKIAEKYLYQDKVDPVAVIHLDETRAFIAMFNGKRLEYYRDLPVTVSKLRDALSSTLGTERGVVSLSKDDIQSILFENGIGLSGSTLYRDKVTANEVLSMVRSLFERFAQEIKRSMAYYKTQLQGPTITRVFLSGLGANIPNIDKFISQESALDIKKMQIGFPNEDICDVGLSLDFEHNVNLLPREFRTEKFEKIQKFSLRWVSFVVFLMMIVFYIFGWVRIGLYQKRLNNSSVQLNILSEIKQVKDEQETLSGLMAQARAKEPSVPAFLKTLSVITGPNIILSNISLQLNTKTGSMDGFIAASDKDPEDVLSKFIADLEIGPFVLDATVVDFAKNQDSSNRHFNLSLKLE
ncbi:MAG: pilus assembly protein PilM [Candidatus Omnitrophica bacterium]|nr:pilus assembly protein PilM [Candidatus Omnitrophota bacterium]